MNTFDQNAATSLLKEGFTVEELTSLEQHGNSAGNAMMMYTACGEHDFVVEMGKRGVNLLSAAHCMTAGSHGVTRQQLRDLATTGHSLKEIANYIERGGSGEGALALINFGLNLDAAVAYIHDGHSEAEVIAMAADHESVDEGPTVRINHPRTDTGHGQSLN